MKIDEAMYEILVQWVEMLQNEETAAVIDEMMDLVNSYEQS